MTVELLMSSTRWSQAAVKTEWPLTTSQLIHQPASYLLEHHCDSLVRHLGCIHIDNRYILC